MATVKKKKKKKGESSIGDESASRTIKSDEAKSEKESQRFYANGALSRVAAPATIGNLGPAPQVSMISRDDPYAAGSIAQAEQAYNSSLQTDPYVKAALEKAQGGLSGYSTEENQALRAQGQRNITANASSGMRQLKLLNGQSGASGMNGSAVQLLKQAALLRAQNETDITAKNVEEQDKRLQSFGNLANTSYVNAAGVRSDALKSLLGERQGAADYTLQADKTNAVTGVANAGITRDYAAKNADIDQSNITNARDSALTNLSQQEKEIAGRAGVYYGSQAASIARRQADKANRAAKAAANIAAQGA